ncbi:hypothetical protein [Micromonospora endophytica]|uniref:Uncharacterized protein n=1 Tax=Micromonospora endophytica TaxID=515350 RepID=A0A2W2D9H4_9ACTN|nr:hypothetical protein [Micromonospora endophytica]PZF96647.1 hypothetical protein C1I93_13665 [Micromonospora endophytica]RIW44139.1 hypothetical protein D3H59_18340 [Micromonospora endophytica]
MDTLTSRGRAVRVGVTGLALAVLLAGTIWGEDDHFPFGPFRMYSTSDPPDADARDTRVEGVDRTGALVDLGERATGIRRAEIEGQQARYTADPSLLSEVAEAYTRRHPDAPELTEVRIVVRWHDITDRRPTGRWSDETVVRWQVTP